jgi:hypothetical protein
MRSVSSSGRTSWAAIASAMRMTPAGVIERRSSLPSHSRIRGSSAALGAISSRLVPVPHASTSAANRDWRSSGAHAQGSSGSRVLATIEAYSTSASARSGWRAANATASGPPAA